MNSTICGVPVRLAASVAVLILLLSFALNYRFMYHVGYQEIMKMNDVSSIMDGYHRSPKLSQAMTAYWHAPWIQKDIYCFRPVSGFQYWLETYVGLHKGFLWDAWVGGYLLFAISAWLCAMITYRLTRSVALTVFAAAMACGVRFYNSCQPDMWLAWYPMHQDLLMMVYILGAVLAFDVWLAGGSPRALAMTWCLFVLGCLTKEYLYAFPFMAASLAFYRPAASYLERRLRLIQPTLFALFVGMLLILRKHMYAHPRDPHFRPAVIEHKPAMFMYNNLASDVITSNWIPIILGAIIVAFFCAFIYVRTRKVDLGWFGKIYVIVPAAMLVVLLAMQLVTGSVAIPFMELLEIQVMQTKLVLDAVFIFTIVVTIRNWNRGSMAVAWLMLFWSYLPVISFIGWHYAFPGGLFRSIYWAVWIQALAVQILEDFPRLPPWLLGRLIPAPAADDGHFLD